MNRQAGFAQSSPPSASTLPAEALPGIHSRSLRSTSRASTSVSRH